MNQPGGEPYQTGANNGVDLAGIMARAKEVVLSPAQAWTRIKAEQTSIADIYKNYLIYIALIPAVAGFLGGWLVGINLPFVGTWHTPFLGGLISHVVQYGLQLGMVFVMASIISFVAPKFGGSSDRTSAFKLVAYAMTPALTCGILGIIPSLMMIGALLSFYSVYVFYIGITPVVGVPTDKRLVFTLVCAGLGIVAAIVISAVVMAVTPRPQMMLPSVNPQSIDFRNLEQGLKNLNQMLPKTDR